MHLLISDLSRIHVTGDVQLRSFSGGNEDSMFLPAFLATFLQFSLRINEDTQADSVTPVLSHRFARAHIEIGGCQHIV